MDTLRHCGLPAVIVSTIFVFVHADNAGNCQLYYENGTRISSGWRFGVLVDTPIRDGTPEGTPVTAFLSDHIKEVISYESKYLAVSYDASKRVQVYLDKAIRETDKDSHGQPELLTSINIKFSCQQGDASIYIYIPVRDYITDRRPQFSSSVYAYVLPMPYPPGVDLTSLYSSIYVTDLDFSNSDVGISTDEAGKRYFNISFATRTGRQYVAKLETTSRIHFKQDFVFNITATETRAPQLNSTALVRIIVDTTNSDPVSPTFEESVYISTVSEINSGAKFPRDVKLYGTNLGNVTLQLRDVNKAGWDEYFSASLTGSIVGVTATRKLPEALVSQTVAVIELQAFLTNAEYIGRTVLLIAWPNNCTTLCSTVVPQRCPTMEIIKTSVTTPGTAHSEQDTVPFKSQKPSTSPMSALPTSATTESTTGSQSSVGDVSSANTSPSPQTDPSFEINTLAAATDNDEYLHFEQSEYNITAVAKQIGILYQFAAVTSHKDEVVFGIDTDDVRVNETFKMGPASGLLYADEGLTAGEYHFNVTAEVYSTQEHAEATVNVIVTDKWNTSKGARLCDSLQVYSVLEEQTTGVTLKPPCTLNISFSCTFSVIHQTPGGDFFRFDKNNGTLQVSGRIDREDAVFAAMPTPAVITMALDVTCAPHMSGGAIHATQRSAGCLQNVVHSYASSIITVKVEIEDVNDNPPVFSVDTLVVGYPAEDVANEILPSLIATVKANDKDAGVNAQIRYSIMPSEYGEQVTIHPRTGAVYPTRAFRYTDIIFTVLAQDRDGKHACNNATLPVQLKIVERDEISVVFIEDSVIEDASSIMRQLRNASNYTFYVLDAGVVSSSVADNLSGKTLARDRRMTNKDSQATTVLRVAVYAMDEENNIVSHTHVHEVLSKTALVTIVTQLPGAAANKDLTSMVEAVIVLSTLLASILLLFIVGVYIVYVRPRRFGVFITPPATDFDSTQKLLETMEPGSLSEPMVTNEMERIVINVKDTDRKMECEQKSESGSTERTAIKSDKTNKLEELPPFVPLQRATPSATPSVPRTDTLSPRPDKKSPKPRKRSQPVRGDLIPDPDKLLSYKKHEGLKKEEEKLEDPTVPGGVKPREPRLPGDEAAERKRSTVTFSTVVETIDA